MTKEERMFIAGEFLNSEKWLHAVNTSYTAQQEAIAEAPMSKHERLAGLVEKWEGRADDADAAYLETRTYGICISELKDALATGPVPQPQGVSEEQVRNIEAIVKEWGKSPGTVAEDGPLLVKLIKEFFERETLKLRRVLEHIVAVASGENQVANDDTEGMAYIDKYARNALLAQPSPATPQGKHICCWERENPHRCTLCCQCGKKFEPPVAPAEDVEHIGSLNDVDDQMCDAPICPRCHAMFAAIIRRESEAEGESRGRAEGLEEAAKVCVMPKKFTGGLSQTRIDAWEECAIAIRALLSDRKRVETK